MKTTRLGAAGVLAACLLAPAWSQTPVDEAGTPAPVDVRPVPPDAVPACPRAREFTTAQLFGLWQAEIEAPAERATLLLERNAEHAGSFGGTIARGGLTARLAGDLDDGEFTLEESADGVAVSATWVGELVEGSCGREVRGTWESNQDRRERPFILRRAPAG